LFVCLFEILVSKRQPTTTLFYLLTIKSNQPVIGSQQRKATQRIATATMMSFNKSNSRTAAAAATAVHVAFIIVAVVTTASIGVVTAERNRIDRGSIRGSYQRPNRTNPSSSSSITQIDNNTNNNSNNNNVLVPQCDPNNPNSYYNTNNPIDTTNDCDRFLEYCDKSMSTLTSQWSSNGYIYPNDFYNTVVLMYDRCSKSCSDHLDGGIKEFCSMPEVNTESVSLTASFNSASNSDPTYCGDSDSYWTNNMVSHEIEILQELNNKRNVPTTCKKFDYQLSKEISTNYPKASPVVMNESLRCAARIQAKNIVDTTLSQGGKFPSNLHQACPPGGDSVCEGFSIRMTNAGYEYETQGFGSINEVTAAGYGSASSVIQGWLSSKSGHCSSIMKQQSLVVPTEVGIGYYEEGGTTAHVMVVAQRTL
jgi:hypothetical protein